MHMTGINTIVEMRATNFVSNLKLGSPGSRSGEGMKSETLNNRLRIVALHRQTSDRSSIRSYHFRRACLYICCIRLLILLPLLGFSASLASCLALTHRLSLLLLHTLFFADVNPYVNPLAMDRNKVSSPENSSRLNPLSYTRSPTPGPGHANRRSLSSLANAKGSKAAASITLLIQLCSFPFSRNSTGTTTSNAFSA